MPKEQSTHKSKCQSKRNPAIELWRCICMFAVVYGHVVVNNHVGTMNGFVWHIPGFLLITGFFGVRFRWCKVIKLLSICYACYWLTIPLQQNGMDWGAFIPRGGWFVPFYVVLMMLSPILDAAIAQQESHRQMALMICFLLLFAWLPCFVPRLMMMRIGGMQGNGLLLMMATYILGRLFAEHRVLQQINGLTAAFMFVLFVAIQIVLYGIFPSAGGYVSPLSILTAFCGFSCVAKCKMPWMLERIIVVISPSMFGVYLLHECCVRHWQHSDFAAQSWGHAFIWAFCLFVVCLGIDFLRRFLFYIGSRFITREFMRHNDNPAGNQCCES